MSVSHSVSQSVGRQVSDQMRNHDYLNQAQNTHTKQNMKAGRMLKAYQAVLLCLVPVSVLPSRSPLYHMQADLLQIVAAYFHLPRMQFDAA